MLSPVKQICNKVRATISRYDMIHQGEILVVAVSGGPDSVCLLHLLHELREEFKISLVVAHYEHGLRPSDDERETAFVRGVAGTLDLAFETAKAPPSLRAKTASLEERARNARYAFLETVKLRHSAHKIALGHHLNDQAETVLMRLLRGSGPSGLTGIPPSRDGSMIRPLIEIERGEIQTYLKARKLEYVTDSSNLRTDHLRNKIRLELMPLLEQVQPQIVKLLGQAADILREENTYLQHIAQGWLARGSIMNPDHSFQMPISSFLRLPLPLRRRVTRGLIEWVKRDLRRISWDHVESIQKLAQSGKPQASCHLPGGLIVKRTYDLLCFSAEGEKRQQPFSYTLKGPGKCDLKKIRMTMAVTEVKNRKGLGLGGSPWTAFLDAGKLAYPLSVRSFKPGDRFVPLGMTGHKKLKDFFVDLKVPTKVRYSTPLLCHGDRIVWVCGFRIDDRFKVMPETKRVMKVTLDRA